MNDTNNINLPDRFRARIEGVVRHRVGDGVLDDIPTGLEVQVDSALASMVLSWYSEDQPVTVTIAKDEFFYYVENKCITLLEAK